MLFLRSISGHILVMNNIDLYIIKNSCMHLNRCNVNISCQLLSLFLPTTSWTETSLHRRSHTLSLLITVSHKSLYSFDGSSFITASCVFFIPSRISKTLGDAYNIYTRYAYNTHSTCSIHGIKHIVVSLQASRSSPFITASCLIPSQVKLHRWWCQMWYIMVYDA